MQRALIRYSLDAYVELIAHDAYQYNVNTHDSTTNLCHNAGYSPELIQLLNDNYFRWVLILSESNSLLVGYYASTGCVLAYGESANIIDWARDVTTYIPYAPTETVEGKTVDQLFPDSSVGPLLDYLSDGFIPQLSDHKVLHLVQTGNGIPYWGRFLPDVYLQ